ncbi:hypothetical protein ZIOFF_070322 [Zingiber officinale]|uniref:Uncharacterized protein n=1 Tax=Zingiber officinale TaxID=94328 RepID=A0A8J5CCD8_ZINOF|nr:hypothetical protein ZIOFF_070322 [Zingiber officinale]
MRATKPEGGVDSLDRGIGEVVDGDGRGKGEGELVDDAAGAVEGKTEEGREGEGGVEAVAERKGAGERAPGREIEGAEVEAAPAARVEGGAVPGLADKGDGDGEISEGEKATTTYYVTLHPNLKGMSGKYFDDCNEENMSNYTKDKELARKF